MTLSHFKIRLRNRRASNEELLDDLRRVFRACRRRPISQDIYTARGQFGVNTYVARFGTWNEALLAFGECLKKNRKASPPKTTTKVSRPCLRAPRRINWRLRASVLIRDNCLCRMCGAGPGKGDSAM